MLIPSPLGIVNPKHFYGWTKQELDFRDLKYSPPPYVVTALPSKISLEDKLGPCLDQGSIGSCGPHSADGCVMFEQGDQGMSVSSVSRLFIYYTTRMLMGTINQDSGVDNRSMLKAMARYGYCDESLWPYNVNKFREQPSQEAITAAVKNRITSYAAVAQTLDDMKGCLVAGATGHLGGPFVFGFSVYESFESPEVERTGDAPMPQKNERLLGGHDVVVYGYDDSTQRFYFRNSWGKNWGNNGNGSLPYSFCTNPQLANDFWVLNSIPGGSMPPVPPPVPPSPPTPPPTPPTPPAPPTTGHKVTVFIDDVLDYTKILN